MVRTSYLMVIAGLAGCSDPGFGSGAGDGGLDAGGDVAVDTGGTGDVGLDAGSEWTKVEGAGDIIGKFMVTGMNGRLIAVGGVTGTQTWEFAGSKWTDKTATVGKPPPNFALFGGVGTPGGAIAGSAAKVVVIGGRVDGSASCGTSGTWEYDGTAWSVAKSPPPADAGIVRGYLAFAGSTGVLLVGGELCNTDSSDTGSRWDGVAWTGAKLSDMACAKSGGGYSGSPLGRDPERDGVILVSNGGDTMRWDGTKCSIVATDSPPGATGYRTFMVNDGTSLFWVTQIGTFEWLKPKTTSSPAWKKVGPPPKPLGLDPFVFGVGAVGPRHLVALGPAATGSGTITYEWTVAP